MTPDDLRKLIIAPDTPVRDAIAAIDRGRAQIALVAEADGRLRGTLTDGDVRRGILRGVALDAPAAEVMNAAPTTVAANEDRAAVRRLMRTRRLHQIPVLDEQGRVTDLLRQEDVFGVTPRETRVVLMAGGLGTRLRPLTDSLPKPMLPVGGKPILEQIVNAFADQGFTRFTISVNYRKEIVQAHFGDGSALGVDIDYIEETQRMGTAGALSMLRDRPEAPFLVMNGDLLVAVRFGALLDFHRDRGAAATLVAREYELQIPYGVLRTDGDLVTAIDEKPTETWLVNGGIYVLSPEVLDLLEPGQPRDMPDLLTGLLDGGHRVAVWALRDYWRDIGRMQDLEAARSEFGDVFGG